MRVTIGIPTRDRPQALSRLLASLHAQTYKSWDLMIIDDSAGPMLDGAGELMLEAIRTSRHRVEVVKGSRINQAYNHNYVLWSVHANRLILRLDDDMILTPSYLGTLVKAYLELKQKGEPVAAVSGVIFTEHLKPRYQYPPVRTALHDSTQVGVSGDLLNAFTFMQEYADEILIPAEHLYSSCLYERDAMRRVGGWPMVYSRGVSYHEETDGTYRLFLAGYKLFLVPAAKAVHSHEGLGGTRAMSAAEHLARRESDWEQFQLRLGLLRGIHWKPTVAVCSQHCEGIGGGQRLTYELVAALQELVHDGQIEYVHLFPINKERLEDVAFVHATYDGAELYSAANVGKDVGCEYDVVISLGHLPPDLGELPPRRRHIHYSLYPLMHASALPRGVDRFVAISEFSANALKLVYHRNAEVIYPFVENLDNTDQDTFEKQDSILLIGRLFEKKCICDLVAAFLRMDLPEHVVLNVVVPETFHDDEGERLVRLAADERVNVHYQISSQRLQQLYCSSAILWAGRGWTEKTSRNPEVDREHFGYTPVEALANLCVPVAFDAGGYQETTISRWSTLEELETITRQLLTDKELWQRTLNDNLAHAYRFTRQNFVLNWWRIIASTNAYTWSQDIEWRQADDIEVVIQGRPAIGLIGGHPRLNTGYGVVCRMLAAGMTEFDVHVLGINGHWPDFDGRYASLWPHHKNVDIKEILNSFLEQNYSCIVIAYDPFNSSRIIRHIRARNKHVPIVAYVSQEGCPAENSWPSILAQASRVLTYSQAAANAVMTRFGETRPVDFVHLGVDHAAFQSYPAQDLEQLRKLIGWEDFFIIFNVATNTSNKGLGRLMKAVSSLRNNYGYDNLLLALHTDPVPSGRAGGIEIELYANVLNLNSDGQRNVVITRTADGIGYTSHMHELFRAGMPLSAQQQDRLVRKLGLIDFYNLADLYVDVSAAEGFGLPLFEAMACGVPCLTVDDGYVRREVIGDHPSLIPTSDIEVFTNGADMMLAHPDDIARRIDAFLRTGSAIRGEYAAGIVERLKWAHVQDKIIAAIKQCIL